MASYTGKKDKKPRAP